MEAHIGWPYLAGLALISIGAGDMLRSAMLRQRLFLAMAPVERAFLVGSSGLLLVTWWSVLLAEFGWFGAGAQALLPALVFFLLVPGRIFTDRATGWLRPRPRRWRLDPRAVALIPLVALATTLYTPPFDVRFEARDPGVYYLAGVQLAQRGGLQWEDRLLQSMPAAEREAWYPQPEDGAADQHRRFVGFYLDAPSGSGRAVVKPQAMPAYPTWVATGQLSFGWEGALAAAGVSALLGAIAWMMFVGRWVSPLAGALVGLAVSANFVEAWFGRFSAAEMSAQAFIGIGLYGLVAYRRHGDALLGWLAAGGIGLAWLTKAELLLLAAPLALLLAHDVARDGIVGRDWARFWLPLGALLAHTVLHGYLLLWPYFYNLMQQARVEPSWFVPGVVAGAAVFLALLAGLVMLGRRYPLARGVARAARALSAAAALCAIPFVGWGLWFRVQAPSWEAANFRHLLWAVSPVGVILAVAGVVVVGLTARGSRWRDAALALIVAAVVLGLLRRQIIPTLPWAYRRWVPLVLPGVFALAAPLLAIWTTRWNAHAPRYAAAMVALAVGGVAAFAAPYQWERIRLYAEHRELPGSAVTMERWQALLGPEALVIFEPRTLRGVERFEAALAVLGGYDVLRMPRPDFEDRLVVNAVRRAAREGNPAYLVTTGYLDGLEQPSARRLGTIRFASQRLFEPYVRIIRYRDFSESLPTRVEEFVVEAAVFRLDPSGELAPIGGNLNIGGEDELYLVGSGFHGPEIATDGTSFRWTLGTAEILLPGLGADAGAVIVRAAPAPTDAHPEGQEMVVLLDGAPLGTVLLSGGWNDYRFELPQDRDAAGDTVPRLRIETPTFRPIQVLPGNDDRRTLGLALAEVRWEPVDPAPER